MGCAVCVGGGGACSLHSGGSLASQTSGTPRHPALACHSHPGLEAPPGLPWGWGVRVRGAGWGLEHPVCWAGAPQSPGSITGCRPRAGRQVTPEPAPAGRLPDSQFEPRERDAGQVPGVALWPPPRASPGENCSQWRISNIYKSRWSRVTKKLIQFPVLLLNAEFNVWSLVMFSFNRLLPDPHVRLATLVPDLRAHSRALPTNISMH